MPSDYRDVYFPSADGAVQLYARDYPGAGPALLLMHGLTRNSADFEGLAAHLAGRYRLIVPDQRGRGRSELDPDPDRYALDFYCADMLALIARLGLDRPVLLGTSMGGLIGMLMAAQAPGAYRGLILNDVGPVVDPAGLSRIAGYVGRSAAAVDWSAAAAYCRQTNGAAFPAYDDPQWLAFARRVFRAGDDGRLHLAYDPAIAAALMTPKVAPDPEALWPVWDALEALPILAIRGALSDVLGAATLDRMRAVHPGLAICTVPGVGHAPMLDEPEPLAAITAFLDGIAPVPA